MSVVPLVVTTRGLSRESGAVENVHHGAIAVVAADGRLLYRAGDADYPTFTRSTLKPFQALPFVLDGGPAYFGFTTRELALMCASHSGETMHVDVVAGMLKKIGCVEADLQCGCHVPGFYAALDRKPLPDAVFTPIQNNCSGKHAGFLAACRMHGEPLDSYLEIDHDLQHRVHQIVADIARVAPDTLAVGIDGCSAPNYAMPLARLAHMYARLAQGAADAQYGDGLAALFEAVTQHPDLVSGTARSDLALMTMGKGTMGAGTMEAGDWVTKIGADGVQAIGVRSAGLGIALKIADGNRDALYCAIAETLLQLGLVSADLVASGETPLTRWHNPTLRNARGMATGEMRAVFTVQKA